jgi:hypothetical protein
MKHPIQPELPVASESGDLSGARDQTVEAREYALFGSPRRAVRGVAQTREDRGAATLGERRSCFARWCSLDRRDRGRGRGLGNRGLADQSPTVVWAATPSHEGPPGSRSSADRDRGGRLQIDRFSMDCEVLEGALPRICLPPAPSLADRLRVRHQYTDEEIRRSGLAKLVEDAEAERDDLLQKAMSHLRQLGVKPAALRRFVQECIVGVHPK